MSMTSAKKKRSKLAREGKRNPEQQRLTWNGLNPVAKTTPTLKERVIRETRKHKHKWNPNRIHGDDSISIFTDFRGSEYRPLPSLAAVPASLQA
ncbi:hypothetical protein [Paenibacillus eucommiae]|uniref:Uncharacterized protein n=1 Tax=Paenibacillus eucommiae TaxID=1355755 RepID=A0ABS4IN51_9BACL|nr:hypothetical protein [Paenibacillus eucommiae]MBP1988997.1 hypothetical protein [Paenibacillus eucommiae]